jgi:hypothetical protein
MVVPLIVPVYTTVFFPDTAPKLIVLPLMVPETMAMLRQGVPLTTMPPPRVPPVCVQVRTKVPPAWSGV